MVTIPQVPEGEGVLAWKAKYWTALHRVHYTVIVVALIAMLWWVNANCLWVFCL